VEKINMKTLPIVLCLVLTLFVLSVPQASAQTINACFSKNGTLRIASPSDPCTKNETAISWAQTGPPGPQGYWGEGLPCDVVSDLNGPPSLPYHSFFTLPNVAEFLWQCGQNANGSITAVYMQIKALAPNGLRLGYATTGAATWVWSDILSYQTVQDLGLADVYVPPPSAPYPKKRYVSGLIKSDAGVWTFQIAISTDKFAFVQVVPALPNP
jgi:hypothetical protein